MRASIFAIGALCMLGRQGPVPKTTVTDSVKQNPTDNRSKALPPAPVVSSVKTNENQTSENAPKATNSPQTISVTEIPPVSVTASWRDDISLFFDLILVIVTATQAYLLWRTLRFVKIQSVIMRRQTRHIARQALSMRRQTTLLRNSVVQARKGAKAAFLNARAVIDSERPWIDIVLGPAEPDSGSGLFQCSVKITNHGRTVAHIETVHIGIESITGQFPVGPLAGTTKRYYTLLGSGQTETVGGFDADSLPNGTEIVEGTLRGFLQIIVKYRDVLKGTIIHETSVVYIFQGSLEDPPERISVLNGYS